MKLAARDCGRDGATLTRRIVAYSIAALLCLSAYAMWTDFVPSVAWLHWGFYLSITSALLMTIYLYWGFGTGRIKMQERDSKTKKIFALLFLPCLVFGVFWLVLVHALADIFTLTIGTQHQESALLLKEYSSSRRSCHYRLTGESLNRAFPSYICLSSSAYNAMPSYPLLATLEGKFTSLGFHVRQVYVNTNPAAHSIDAPGTPTQ